VRLSDTIWDYKPEPRSGIEVRAARQSHIAANQRGFGLACRIRVVAEALAEFATLPADPGLVIR